MYNINTGQVATQPVLLVYDLEVVGPLEFELVHRYLDNTFRDKEFCHMIIIQAALLLVLC